MFSSRAQTCFAVVCFLYVAIVLFVDHQLINPTNYNAFRFVFWFIIPCILFFLTLYIHPIRKDYRDWLNPKYVNRKDVILVISITVCFMLVLLFMPYIPGVNTYYRQGNFNLFNYSLWLIAWLPGWELMHRVLLLMQAEQIHKRWAWLMVPMLEGIYHYGKPVLEVMAMFGFSFLMCWWTMKRRNALVPITAHLLIELLLGVYLAG